MTAIVGLYNEMHFWPGSVSPGVTNFSLNASTDFLEYIFQAAEDATITRLGFRQNSVAGTSPTYKVSLQGVDGTGIPNGTILGGGSPASTTFQPVSGGNATWQWKTLDNSIAVTRGQWLAMVIGYESGTIDGSNLCSFGQSSSIGHAYGSVYSISNDAGSRTRSVNSPLFGYGSASRAYGMPLTTLASTTFNSGSTPDERAALLTIPATWCSSYKIAGAVLYTTLAATGAFDLVLYDTDGTTVLQSVSHDTDIDAGATAARQRPILFDESTLSTLVAGSSYRLAIKPTTGNITYTSLTVATNDDMDAYFGGHAVCKASTRTDGGAWTDSDLTRFGINPIIGDITVPSGGGGARARLT